MAERRIHDFLPEIKDYYTVTDEGEFYSDNSGKMKTRNRAGTDYQIINFSTIDGKKRTFRAHRLVMMAFEPREDMDKLEVNHIDGDKKNNKLENLEWCTSSENQKHAFKTGLQVARKGEASNWAKFTEDDIHRIFELRSQGWLQREIAEEIGCSRPYVSKILHGDAWKHLGCSTTTSEEGTPKQVEMGNS